MANSSDTQGLIVPRNVHRYNIRNWSLYEWGLCASALIIIIALAFFVWADKTIFEFHYPIQYDKFGNFGDFVGGIVGTLFAFLNVHLLIKTIGLQNKANAQTEKSYNYVQRTENTRTMDTQISSLFALYNDTVSSLSFQGCNGKAAIVGISSEILSKSTTIFSNDGDDKRAMLAFESEYAAQRDRLAVYFRVVYRMLCLLLQSDIEDRVRYNYAKMIRCQLTESELCLLRYNALTYNGRNIQDKILKFNLLKHLPASKLFDVYPFYRHLNENLSNHLDVMLYDLRKKLEETFVFGNNLATKMPFPTNLANLSLFYNVAPSRRRVDIIFRVNRRISNNSTDIERAIVRYSDAEIRKFFQAYLLELFSKSMFQVYAKVEELKFKRTRTNNAVCLSMTLECQNPNRILILTRKQLDRPMLSVAPVIIGNHIL